MRTTRRTFTAAALAAAATAALGRRPARAGAPPPSARRLLVLHADGGLRSTACFQASSERDLNPWGVATTTSTGVALGALVAGDHERVEGTWSLPAWGGREVPRLATVAERFAVIAATDHRPDGSMRAGDHGDDEPRMATGDASGAPGLLTVVNRWLGDGASAPVMMNAVTPAWGAAPGDWQSAQPTTFEGRAMPSAPPPLGRAGVGARIEDAIDARHLATRRGTARERLAAIRGYKATMRRFGPLLADPRLRPAQDPDAELGGVTNRMLMEAIGATGVSDDLDLAVALRALQLGSPAVCVAIPGFDLHSEERAYAPPLYARFARYLCGIHFSLSELDEPDGAGKMIDHTLVVTTSEFGRNAHPGGWNEGEGSDHAIDDAWRYQAHVIFGAGVRPKLLHPTDAANAPRAGVCSTQALLVTLAAALGVPEDELDRIWPAGTPLRPETAPLWVLWE